MSLGIIIEASTYVEGMNKPWCLLFFVCTRTLLTIKNATSQHWNITTNKNRIRIALLFVVRRQRMARPERGRVAKGRAADDVAALAPENHLVRGKESRTLSRNILVRSRSQHQCYFLSIYLPTMLLTITSDSHSHFRIRLMFAMEISVTVNRGLL